ncbi:hypothetical protein AAGH91_28800, partial [Escherichia coli]
HDSYSISEKSHGREETRLHIVCDVPDELIDFTFEWKGLNAYSALFDHGLASKSDQRFASIRSTGNLTFSTAF